MRNFLIGTLLVTLPLLASCQSPTTATPGTSGTTPAANTVTISGFKFTPDTLTVKTGDTVTWVNNDQVPHTASADDQSFDTQTIGAGKSAVVKFDKAGTFAYHCNFHASMKATIKVNP